MNNNSLINMHSVSIICTSYNQLDYLLVTIKSILEQIYTNIELILVDDASDCTEFNLESITKFIIKNNINDIPFEILINDSNLGHAESLNKGISKSNGNFFIFVNGDDILPKDAVQSLMLEQVEGNHDICFGVLAKFNGEYIFPQEFVEAERKFHELLGLSQFSLIERIVTNGYLPFAIPGSLISRDLFNEIGGFENGYKYLEDLLFLFKIAIKTNPTKFGFSKAINYIWRDYSGITGSNNLVANHDLLKKRIYLVEDYLKAFEFFKNKISQINHSNLEIHCQKKIKIFEFKRDYLKARVNNDSIYMFLKIFYRNKRIIFNNLSLRRIYRYLCNRFGA